MVLNLWKARTARRARAEALYRAVVRQTRRPEFYTSGGVADTFEGSFDLLVAHLALVLHRLKGGDAHGKAIAQRVLDLFFADMDAALRELGVGDMGVGRRVRKMSEAFYGRLEAYDAGLADEEGDTLREALARNLYGGEAADHAAVMAGYMRATAREMGRTDLEGLISGAPFRDPPEFNGARAGQAGRAEGVT